MWFGGDLVHTAANVLNRGASKTADFFTDLGKYTYRMGDTHRTAIRVGEEGGEKAVQFRRIIEQGEKAVPKKNNKLSKEEMKAALRIHPYMRQGGLVGAPIQFSGTGLPFIPDVPFDVGAVGA